MWKKIIFFSVLFCQFFIFSRFNQSVYAAGCDFTVGSTILSIDGRSSTCRNSSPYMCVPAQPGQTICLAAGSRNKIIISNINGTAAQPITIINSGGLVDFNQTPDGSAGITINNSHYFRLTGTGDSNFTYGIKISKTSSYALGIFTTSDNYTVDHLEVSNIAGGGFSARTHETCPDGSGAFDWDTFDYNGDGQITSADRITRQNPDGSLRSLSNMEFRDNYLHDLGSDGMYIGSPGYSTGTVGTCGGTSYTVYPLPFINTKIHDNRVEITQKKGIMAKSVISGCQVYHNYIYRDSLSGGTPGQYGFCAGIQISEYNNCEVHHNTIEESNCMAILLDDKMNSSGSKIYDNLIIRPGNWIGAVTSMDKSYGIYSLGKNNYVMNNTIIDSKDEALEFPYQQTAVQNNLVIKSVGLASDIGVGTLVSNNLISTSVVYQSNPLFTDPANGDYTLAPNSSAIDAGTTSLPFQIATDLAGNARFQGAAYDIGAYEHLASSASPTPVYLKGDINQDHVVNIQDYTLLSNAFGTNNAAADLNSDGTVNVLDYILLSNNFGKSG